MPLTFLGKTTNGGQSPTLYLSEDRTHYLVQGWRTDEEHRLEIPHALLQYLAPGTCLGTTLFDSGHGTFTLTGKPVTDADALNQMDIPAHEDCVEVPVGQEIRPDATPLR